MKNKIGIFTLFLCSGLMLFESLNILTSAAPPTTDQFLFHQKPASGPFNQFGVTPISGQAFGWNGSTVVMLPTSGGSFQPLNSTLTAISANSGAVDISGTTLTLPTSFITATGTQTLTNKTISGANNTLTVRLANDVTGNLGVSHLNSGTSASSSTFWRGDGTWATAGSNYDPAAVAITGGTITGTPISGSTGAFTTLSATGALTLGTGFTIDASSGNMFLASGTHSIVLGDNTYQYALIVANGVVNLQRGLISTDTNILALRNGPNAQEFNVYGTYTDASNFEYVFFNANSSGLNFGHTKLGTGTYRPINFYTGNSARWSIDTSGHFLAATDNTYDIGASGANRPRKIYAADGLYTGPSGLTLPGSVSLVWTGQGYFTYSGDGVITAYNSSVNGFDRFQLGGTTASFPAIKRNGAGIDIRLADDSALGDLQARVLTGSAVTVLPVSLAANNTIWSDGVHLYWRDDSGSDHQLDNP